VKRGAEEDWGTMTTLTLRYLRGHFIVVGPYKIVKFKTRREAKKLVRRALPRFTDQGDRC
jgi:hypothetical protein